MPAGTGPAGLGTPALVADAPADKAGSRYLNPITKDYQLSAGQFAQMPPVRQQVLLALTTARGSSTAQPAFGIRSPRKVGGRFVAEMRVAVRAALAHLTTESRPRIRIERIDVEKVSTGHVRTTVSYVDLTTGRPDEVSA